MVDDLSFPADRRLSSSKSIQSILNDGDLYKGDFCHLFHGERDDKLTRAAFIVSSKSASKATFRNRIKRLIRESFRLKQNDIEEGWPLVFVATRKVHKELRRQDFDRDLENHFEEAGILKSDE